MKSLRIVMCLFVMLALVGQSMAAPSLNAVQSKIAKAAKIWEKDQTSAQKMLKDAFADAISWTRTEFLESIREKGFYLAVSCYSPELVTETMLAADTYLKIFPAGRYAGKIYIFKAMSAFAVNDNDAAIESLNAARKLAKGTLSYKDQSMFLSGYLTANRHRSAEKFIEGEKLVKPSYKLTKDLRRFHRGNDRIEDLLNQVRAGKISGMAAAEVIDKELDHAYFAKKAPAAALLSASIKDVQKDAYNPIGLEWCGLFRAVKHSSSPQLREAKYQEFLKTFPEASPEETYQALQNLKNVYSYEIVDKIQARKALDAMKEVPGFKARAEIEEIFADFVPNDLLTEKGNAFLRQLYSTKRLLPYDNGALPVVTRDYVEYLLVISDMVLGKDGQIKVGEQKCWSNLPIALLYFAAIDKKDKAWELFSEVKPTLTPQVDRMLEDCIFPLYLATQPGERYFLAGLAAVEKLPDLGTDLIIRAISDNPRMYRSEHGLAVLADVYNRHIAHREAQKVWKILSTLHPDSIWLK